MNQKSNNNLFVDFLLAFLKGTAKFFQLVVLGFISTCFLFINTTIDIIYYFAIGFYAFLKKLIKGFIYVCRYCYFIIRAFGDGVYFVFVYSLTQLFKPKKPKKKKTVPKPKTVVEAVKPKVNIFENKNDKDKKEIVPEKKGFNKILEFIKKKYNSSTFVMQKKAKLEAEKQGLISLLNTGNEKRSEDPIVYKYKAKNANGKLISGIFLGYSKMDVNAFLVNDGYEVYSIETNKMITNLYGQKGLLSRKMNNKDLIFWLTQLSTYIKSGIPLTEAVKILANQMGKKINKKRIFDSIVYELTMGETFSSALEKQGTIFPSLLVNMLKAAEATGDLESTLDDMSNYYNDIEKTHKQMRSAMTYPILISVFALGVVGFILLYVIPQFVNVYDQANIKLNGFTLAIINFSDFLKANLLYIILIVIVVVILFIFLYKKVKAFRTAVQMVAMKMPLFGKIIIYNELTIFTKTFSSLLKNNVFITDSIDILSKITNNEIYKSIMYATIANVAKGDKISEAFKDHWAVPDVAYYMIVTGESTGELAEMMERVSEYYQENHKSIISNLKAFIEPIMIISLAVIVGGILLAVIIPMFDLYSNIEM